MTGNFKDWWQLEEARKRETRMNKFLSVLVPILIAIFFCAIWLFLCSGCSLPSDGWYSRVENNLQKIEVNTDANLTAPEKAVAKKNIQTPEDAPGLPGWMEILLGALAAYLIGSTGKGALRGILEKVKK